MASSSPSVNNLNLHFSPEWMRAGLTTNANPNSSPSPNSREKDGRLPSAGSTNHLPPFGPNGGASGPGALNGGSSADVSAGSSGLSTPTPTGLGQGPTLNGTPPSTHTPSAYSSLLTPASTTASSRFSPISSKDPAKMDIHDPFRYSREDLLAIWRAGLQSNGGPGWSLGIEVERHEGVVIDLERTPSIAREMTEAETKLYNAPSLNSRRPSISHAHSHNHPRERDRDRDRDRDGEPGIGLGILGRRGTSGDASSAMMPLPPGSVRGGGPISPLRERFPRRGDSSGMAQPYRPRQLASTVATPASDGNAPALISPRAASSGFGFGGGPGFDGVLGAGEGWGGRKRAMGRQGSSLKEIQERTGKDDEAKVDSAAADSRPLDDNENEDGRKLASDTEREEPAFENWEDDPEIARGGSVRAKSEEPVVNGTKDGQIFKPPNPAEVTWVYLDDQQIKQGPFTPDQLRAWDSSGWLRPDLRMSRPDYDTLLIPLSEWKSKLHALGIADEKLVFHTWYEPVKEEVPKEDPAPPPGLARPQTQTQEVMKENEGPTPVPETAGATAETPSVFDALRKAESAEMGMPGSLHGIGVRGTHTPGSIFSSAADPAFSHSPVSSHRHPTRSGTLETGSSSPASNHAAASGAGNNGFDPYPGLTGSRLQQFNHLTGQLSPTAFQGLNHSPIPSVLARPASQGVPSPLVAYAGITPPYIGPGEAAPAAVQTPYSQNGSLYSSSILRQSSFDQQSSSSAPWQSHRSNLAPGSATGIPPRTGSSGSSQSGNHRAGYGSGRPSSPAAVVGSLTGGLGGEIYDGVVGSAPSNAIGRGPGLASHPTNQSPQQLFGTPHRAPVGPIPEASSLPQDAAPTTSVDASALGVSKGPAASPAASPTADAPAQKTGYASIVQKRAGTENLDATKDAAADVGNSPTVPPQPVKNAWNLPPQPSEARSPAAATTEAPNLAEIVQQSAKGKAPRKRDSSVDVATGKKAAPAAAAPVSPQESHDDSGFTSVKKRSSTSHVASSQPHPPASSNPNPTIVSSSASQPTSPAPAPAPTPASKISVPLASLITNATSPNSSPVSAPAPKAWAAVAVKDEAKSLKEIQEAEERLAKENQKARHPNVAQSHSGPPSASKDEELTTMSWGLPISLAGGRAGAASKDASTPQANAPAPVWANAVKTAAGSGPKKAMTMKDIQEEEERRKQKERETTTTAAKRVSERKAPPPTTVAAPGSGGGAWATVGPGGKATRPSTGGASSSVSSAPTGIASLPPRPSAAAIASSGMRASHVTTSATSMTAASVGGASARRLQNAPAAASVSTSKQANVEEPLYGVSADTLRWMRETLKGKLSKGITVDEVVGLVLMMQEEDDIADTIYQSSPTLPGKRFAAEFIEKRNADKANGASTTAVKRPSATSNADVSGSVASQDSFGYQVVKKKKGGKA